eukprot:5383317-Amphidinium_carterae.1
MILNVDNSLRCTQCFVWEVYSLRMSLWATEFSACCSFADTMEHPMTHTFCHQMFPELEMRSAPQVHC